MKTDIVNKTDQSFELKEGNAGAYRLLKQLGPKDKVSIRVDPNATYREYVVATGKKGESIFLTSDDFSEYKVIDIEEGPGQDPGTVVYNSVRSNPRKPGSSKASDPSNVGGAGCKSKAEGGSDAGVGPDLLASASAAGVEPDPPASSAAAVGSVPAVSSAAAAGSVPAVSSAAGAGSNPRALSVASSKPPIEISNQNERVPWYRKLKARFK